jgi:S-DNA-T family DNA segregation ATPase FtsK/SpoIIIE
LAVKDSYGQESGIIVYNLIVVRRRKKSTVIRRRMAARGTMKFEVKSSVMREISAVLYLALAVFTYLSLNDGFGLMGELWMSVLKPILGWGVKLMPFAFVGVSLLLFFSKRVAFTLSRLLGIFLLLLAMLSILHLSVPMDSIYSEASNGNYGGYVGFVTNFVFRELLNVGYLGSAVIFFTIFLIGFLLTFQISIAGFIGFFKPEIKIVRKKSKAVEESEVEEPVLDDEEALRKLEEEDKFTEEDLDGMRFKMRTGDEVVTIKRPVVTPAEAKPKERKIQIIEEDGENNSLSKVDHEEYAGWQTPPMDLLNPAVADITSDDALLQENAKKIRDKLSQFGIEVDMREVNVGPTVIQYTLRPSEGIKLSKITGLKNDLALALAAKSIRIEAPIPGKSLVGIEVPNDHRSLVHLREILESKEYSEIKSNLRLPVGRDVSGKPVVGDLASMPHLLVAGTTGSGKSVGMNTFLLSLIYQNSPHDLKLIMIDPKRVELTAYNGIPHLLTPVVTDAEKAAIALRWAVAEMNRRYQLCAENHHKNIEEFNTCVEIHEKDRSLPGHEKMPNIVIVIDELADLMIAAGKEVEASICRIAQMARAVGMHLIIATQRPSVDVITGLIKANIPARIAFAVNSQVDSRTIIDCVGAEDLLGKGDMLYFPGGQSKPTRVQGIFVSSKEIERVTNYAKIAFPPSYIEDITSPRVAHQKVQGIPQSELAEADDDELYEQAMQIIRESRKASASLLQRRLKLGYARAARLLDLMEQNGVIGPVNGAKPREIYID